MKKTFFSVVIFAVVFTVLLSACTAEGDDNSYAKADSAAESAESLSIDASVESSHESFDDISNDESVNGSTDESIYNEPLYTAGDYVYTLTNNVAKLMAYTGDESELTLPAELEGYSLTAIESGAFAGSNKLKSLTVSDSVVNIADGGLGGCSSLEYICLGSSVAVFNAFDLAECSALEQIDVSNANTSFSSVSGVLYNGAGTVLLFCPRALTAEVLELPSGLLKIEESAFAECSGIKSITLPDSCDISAFSFFHCTALEEIALSNGVTAIPQKCFFGCVVLKEISVPEGVSEIGDLAFFGCVALSKASIPSSVNSIGNDVFKYCSALKTINVDGEYAKAWYEKTGKDFIN